MGIVTLGEMRTQVTRWLREDWDDLSVLDDAINDAVESLWSSILTTYIEDQMGGPVALTISAGSYRTQLGTIADPVAGPTVNSVAAGILAARYEYYAFTLVTDSGTETNISPITTYHDAAGSHVASVPPPAFVPGTIGWNLYAFLSSTPVTPITGDFIRVNDVPIDYQVTWQELESGIPASPDGPFAPTQNGTADDLFYIEHMEMQMPDLTYKPWNQQPLDSEQMRRAARTIASTSPYQNYYYDVLGDAQFEIRPSAGITLNPQYWYVKKPRRMRYSNSKIPDIRGPYIAFIRYFAITLLKLVEEEYQASQMWEGKANAERLLIKQAYTKKQGKNVQTVTPYITF